MRSQTTNFIRLRMQTAIPTNTRKNFRARSAPAYGERRAPTKCGNQLRKDLHELT